MSRQYLTTHAIDDAHSNDIFSLAVTSSHVFSAGGASSIQVHSTTSSSFPHEQTLEGAHKLGCHHICASADGSRIASVGFGGEIKIWRLDGIAWREDWELSVNGELWAPALSQDGKFLAATTYDGRVGVWNVESKEKATEYETRGSFGLSIDMSHDSSLTATGHASGSMYVFINENGKLKHSLPSLHAPVRTIRFSPLSTLIAAAGDSRVIALFDAQSGEQVASLAGHKSWIMTLDWSSSGEWLASAGWDGQARVWSIDRRECVTVLRDAAGGDRKAGKCVWALRWYGRSGFAVAGSGRAICFYREAAGS